MKKLILLSLLGLFFLAGCGNTNTIDIPIHLTDIEGNDISYTVNSNIFSGNFTGIFEKIPFFEQYDDEHSTISMLGHGSMTGYMYTYTFPKFRIKFIFKDSAAIYFNPQDPNYFEPFMYYSGNTFFYGKPTNTYNQFITIFSKSITSNLKDIIEKNHASLLQDGCYPTIWDTMPTFLSGTSSQYEIYDIEKHHSESCFLGLFFFMNKKEPEKYYMVSYADACAPSCNTFTNIEFF